MECSHHEVPIFVFLFRFALLGLGLDFKPFVKFPLSLLLLFLYFLFLGLLSLPGFLNLSLEFFLVRQLLLVLDHFGGGVLVAKKSLQVPGMGLLLI